MYSRKRIIIELITMQLNPKKKYYSACMDGKDVSVMERIRRK